MFYQRLQDDDSQWEDLDETTIMNVLAEIFVDPFDAISRLNDGYQIGTPHVLYRRHPQRIVPDWPGFDHKAHEYAVETGSGDGWSAEPPVYEAIEGDIYGAAEDCTSEEEECDVLSVDWQHWINGLRVCRKNDPDLGIVAEFDLTEWKWNDLREQTN